MRRAGAARRIVEESLRAVHLWDELKDRLDQSALGLSLEQKQRLCIARLVAVKSEVLLMDEPCSALDPDRHAQDRGADAACSRTDYTIVIVTHNMQQAARVSEETGFMLLGELVEFGRTTDIFTRPRDKRTEDYITGQIRITTSYLNLPVPHRRDGTGLIRLGRAGRIPFSLFLPAIKTHTHLTADLLGRRTPAHQARAEARRPD